jgi:hypothetical protein
MRARTQIERTLIAAGISVAAGFALGGCGSSAGPVAKVTQSTGASSTPATPVAVVRPPRLRILSPKRDSHTGTTVTVSVLLTGSPAGGSRLLRYVLDGSLTRGGPARLTFHGLAPGRHRLEAMLNDDRSVRGGVAFTVSAPAPIAALPVAPSEPAPSQTTASPSPATAPSQTAPPVSTPKPPPSTGIPQGGGGDGDGDNSGGPSDGDGNE